MQRDIVYFYIAFLKHSLVKCVIRIKNKSPGAPEGANESLSTWGAPGWLHRDSEVTRKPFDICKCCETPTNKISILKPTGWWKQIKDLQDSFNLIMVNMLKKGDVLLEWRQVSPRVKSLLQE